MFENLVDAVKAMDSSPRSVFVGAAVTLAVIASLLFYDHSLRESRLIVLEKTAGIIRQSQEIMQDVSEPEVKTAALEMQAIAMASIGRV